MFYSENRNNRARVIIFDIGWGPGCGVGGPGGGFLSGSSGLSLPPQGTSKPPTGPSKLALKGLVSFVKAPPPPSYRAPSEAVIELPTGLKGTYIAHMSAVMLGLPASASVTSEDAANPFQIDCDASTR